MSRSGRGAVLDVARAGGVERLDLDEPVGTGPVEAAHDNVGGMCEACPDAAHPLTQAPLTVALIEEDGRVTKARAQDERKRANGWIVARLLPADADGAQDVVPVDGQDGGEGRRGDSVGRREAAAVAVGDIASTRDARGKQEVEREHSSKVSAGIDEEWIGQECDGWEAVCSLPE